MSNLECEGPVGPGPAQYMMPPTVGYKDHDITRNRGPMYSLGLRPPLKGFGSVGPGPAYNVQKYTRYGAETQPAYSMNSRPKDLPVLAGPAPGAYSPNMNGPNAPAYSMGGRQGTEVKSVGPGPCAYMLPSTMGKGGFSLTSRPQFKDSFVGPGPAGYDVGPLHVYKNKSGAFSITGRPKELSASVQSPGPAAYHSDYNTGKGPYKFSFGVKHSKCAPPYVIPEDNALC